jgi:hypothetical protein
MLGSAFGQVILHAVGSKHALVIGHYLFPSSIPVCYFGGYFYL